MGFTRRHSVKGWKKEQVPRNSQFMEHGRCSLIGNSFQSNVIAWLVGQLLVAMGLWIRAPTPQQCVDGLSADDASTLSGHYRDLQSDDIDPDLERRLVRTFIRGVNHKGSDVRITTGELYHPNAWPRSSAQASLWKWRTILSY